MKPVRAFALAFVLSASSLGAVPILPAYASGGGESASNKTIDMSGLVLPVERDGKLINYLFVSAMITISPKYDHWEVRENAHVYRDLILKEAHRHPVGLEGKPMKLDQEAFEALVHKVFDEELGPDSVSEIEIMAVDSQKIFLDS